MTKQSYLETILLLIVVVFIVSVISALTEKQRGYWKAGFGKIFSSISE